MHPYPFNSPRIVTQVVESHILRIGCNDGTYGVEEEGPAGEEGGGEEWW